MYLKKGRSSYELAEVFGISRKLSLNGLKNTESMEEKFWWTRKLNQKNERRQPYPINMLITAISLGQILFLMINSLWETKSATREKYF